MVATLNISNRETEEKKVGKYVKYGEFARSQFTF